MEESDRRDQAGAGAGACAAVTGESIRPPEKIMDKKSVFDAGKVWLEALYDFENELHEHVEAAGEDQLRFQDGRLFASLTKHIKANATGKWTWLVMFELYQLMTDPSPFPGYDEARRLHGEEMEALGLRSARLFCSSLAKQFGKLRSHTLRSYFADFAQSRLGWRRRKVFRYGWCSRIFA